MIVRDRPSFFQIFFILKGSVIGKIAPQLSFIAVYSSALTWLYHEYPDWFPEYTAGPFSLIGIALSIFLGFRNNVCYDRWWEGRRAWGNLIASTRSFARQTSLLDSDDSTVSQNRREILTLAGAFSQELVAYLRNTSGPLDPSSTSNVAKGHRPRNRPEAILRNIWSMLAETRRRGTLSDIDIQLLDRTVQEFGAVQATCERIRNTPIPFAYTLLLHRTAYFFCILLPIAMVASLGWATPFMAVAVAYTFFGLDALGDELEEPFGLHPNSLPLNALATIIQIDLGEAIGAEELPAAPTPIAFVLS